MAAYFLRRILLLIPTLLGITFLVFSITRFVPGGPIDQMMMSMQAAEGEVASAGATEQSTIEIPEAAMEALNEHYHLDRSFVVAYGYWLKDLLMLDLGTSSKFSKPVLDLIVERFPVSIYFGLVGFTLAYLVCIPLGVLKAVKHGGTFDFVSSVLVFIGYSIPGWALGAVLLVLLGGGSFFDVFPLGEFRSEGWEDFTWYNKIRNPPK